MRQKKSLFYLLILTLFLTFNLISCGGGGGGGGSVTPAQNLRVFVTSETGNGNLTTWVAYTASGSSATGLAAGDAICQYLAGQAGLSGTFRAWLSDTNTDAYCHLHGLTGKKVNNCGQGSLPTPYGPWVRRDGFPFGETINVIISIGQIYAPVLFDETGAAASDSAIFTDTYDTGARATNYTGSCSDWTSAAGTDYVMVGNSSRTTQGWTIIGGVNCGANARLLCFQTGTGPALPSHTTTGKIAFITSAYGNGNLGGWPEAGAASGIAAGDNICKARAAASPISAVSSKANKFKAWLSDSSTDAISRFSYDGPWVRIDGVKIADNKADLTDGVIFSSINQNESGDYYGNYWVWTGTSQSGNGIGGVGSYCQDWTNGSASYTGNGGVAFSTSTTWTNYFGSDCNGTYNLYCFEDN